MRSMTYDTNKEHCIVLHLYYQDLWLEFFEQIEPLLAEVDLVVTIPQDQEVHIQIPSKVKLLRTQNRGMDVGPFLQAIKVLGDYSTITKIHTKKSTHTPGLGDRWRMALTTPLLTNHKMLRESLAQENGPCMVGVESFLVREGSDPGRVNNQLQSYIRTICDKLSIQPSGAFIAGTMFMINNSFAKEYLSEEVIDEICSMFEEGYVRDNSPAHAMERVFGYIATQNTMLLL